jgi:DNA-binding transcriptional LysR family regulator
MDQRDRLDGIVAFVRAAEAHSFVGAAERLGISASAVGKAVARLERSLGVRLFHRSTRKIALTEEGRHFFERCQYILAELDEAKAVLAEAAQQPRGRLRVSLPAVGYRFLLPVLPAFRWRYPDIELDLDFNDRLVDVIDSGFDVVIRSGELADSRLMARRLGSFQQGLYAAPVYLSSAGRPAVAEDLSAHACLRYRFPTTGKLQPWAFDGGLQYESKPTLQCNNMEALREAAIAGLGIAYMPDFLVSDALADGRLEAVLESQRYTAGQFSIVWPSGRQLSPKVRVFVDFMCAALFR